MNFCAIICEFNPFHNGHAYVLKKAKKISGCDAILCIMGGNFSQRGEPTITDKTTRARMAIAGGADAVVQIPTYLCSTNAEVFAKTAVKIATSFDNVTHICFGSESGDLESIVELATLLHKEPNFFKEKVKTNLSFGYSLGMSKTKAIVECIDENLVQFTRPLVVKSLLDLPNNILAVEYVKAMLTEKNKHIVPITVKRLETSKDLVECGKDCEFKMSNATTIRNSLKNSKHIWNIRKYIPTIPYRILAEQLSNVSIPNMDTFGKLALYKFSITNTAELQANYDVVEGIENRLIQCARESLDYTMFLELASSRRFSISRIQRITIATLLNLRSEYVKNIYNIDYLPYVKVLAVINDDRLISSLSKSKSIVVMRKLDAIKAQQDPYGKILMYAEDRADNLYNMLLSLSKEKKHDYAQTSDIFVKPVFVEKTITKVEFKAIQKEEKAQKEELKRLEKEKQEAEEREKIKQENVETASLPKKKTTKTKKSNSVNNSTKKPKTVKKDKTTDTTTVTDKPDIDK